MKYRLACLALVVFAVCGLVGPVSKAGATPFNQNNIIDDSVYDDTTTMTAAQIDAFLNSFPSSCLSTNNAFSAPRPTGYNPSQGYLYGSPVSAGQVIYDAAQAYGLNPQVLLTTLQKEEGLVKGDGPYGCGALAISASAGYACTDTDTASHTYIYTNGTDPGTLSTPLYYSNGVAVTRVDNTCVNSSLKAGFTEQVIRAAWLFKFGEQRSEGNIGWAVIKGNWNNSDDPQTCYGGPMTQGTYQRCPSGAAAYYDGYTTIDGVAVHMDNGATAALYWYTPHFHGNQNFAALFETWFGPLVGSSLVRTVNNATVYLTSGTYKYPISDMGILNDFSPLGYIKYVSDDYVNSFTTGAVLTHMVGGPDGSLYFVNTGIKLPFSSCAMVTDYGYSCAAPITTLTSFQLNKLYTGPTATHLYGTTSGKMYYISAGTKREVFDNQSLVQAGISEPANTLLESGTSYLPYGLPVIRNGVIVNNRSDNTKYLYDTNRYMPLNADLYNSKPLANLTRGSLDNASIPQAQRSGVFNGFFQDNAATKQYVLTDAGKVQLTQPAKWTNTYTKLDDTTLGYFPAGADSANNGVIKSAASASVYYVESAKKRPIPSWGDLVGLHPSPFTISTLPATVVDSMPTGPLMYSPGRLVKDNASATVYVVKGPSELFPITSFTFPGELGLDMSILTISNTDLQTYTKPGLLQTKVVCADGKNYVGINGKLYEANSTNMTQYGFSQSDFVTVADLCSNTVISGKTLTNFIRVNNGTIYSVDNGQKHPITSYDAYLAHGGTSTNTLQVSDYFASLISTGSLITQ